ncbi:probable lysosomal cobalamin transporter [Gigantopelta aegis]|uniref:probable lysosomal cobalamin transporter n=1 Tax=Gigantopelta aegis TaxID=1735272 RepID=UPI001B887C41|nr:probable lysosomal cobalamin transporter [Gigantopelta aegis]
MAIPSAVLAAGWIPFVVVIVLTFLFSVAYVRYYMSKYDSEVSSTIAAILALTVTLLTSALVPVDIFLVSYMKTSDGGFKEWANNSATRTSLEESVLYGYFTLYAIITFCLFLLLPFMYFFYEEKDENSTCKSRCCSSLKYMIVFVIIVAALLLIGAFVPTRVVPNANQTEWKNIELLFKDLASNGGEDSLSFVISCLSLLGMLALVTYTAYGMSALPIGLIKGHKGAKEEMLVVQSKREENESRRQALKEKYSRRKRLSGRNEQQFSDIDENNHLMERQERLLQKKERSCLQKCLLVLRPFEMLFGFLFLLIALLIFISLLLTNIDKAMHSLGYKLGYALPRRHLPNPIDIVLVLCQQVFPLDYILMVGVIAYFIFCSMSGIRNIGVWFLWIRMYKIRPRHTRPQGLLMLCMIMMFIVLAINIVVYELTPQYSSFGSQVYIANYTDPTSNTTSHKTEPCSTEVKDSCVITRMALLLTRFFYKMWFFGAAYYWLTWVFLGIYLFGFVVAVVKRKRSAIDGEVDEDDFDESDEDLIRA